MEMTADETQKLFHHELLWTGASAQVCVYNAAWNSASLSTRARRADLTSDMHAQLNDA